MKLSVGLYVALARPSSDNMAISYVLPVLGWRHVWQLWALWHVAKTAYSQSHSLEGRV